MNFCSKYAAPVNGNGNDSNSLINSVYKHLYRIITSCLTYFAKFSSNLSNITLHKIEYINLLSASLES